MGVKGAVKGTIARTYLYMDKAYTQYRIGQKKCSMPGAKNTPPLKMNVSGLRRLKLYSII